MASVSTIAMWFSENSGSIQIMWLGWEVDTSLSIFLLIVFILIFIVLILSIFFYKLFLLPFKIKKSFKKYNVKKANYALEEGLLASIYNENSKIIKNYKISKKYLKQTPLLLLLRLQYNLIKSNEAECFNTYKKMLNFQASRPIALNGLISIANKNNDQELYSNMLYTARSFKVPLDYYINNAFSFCLKNNNWQVLSNHISTDRKKNQKKFKYVNTILKYFKAKEYYEKGNSEKAMSIIQQTFAEKVFLPPSVELYSRLHKDATNRNLKKLLRHYWRYFPHHNILDCVLDNFKNLSLLKKVKLLIELLDGHDTLYLKYLLLGEIKAKAKIWGDSKKDLLKSIEIFPNKKAYLLLVNIEEQTTCNKDKIKSWLSLSQNYNDLLWKCSSCFSVQKDWSMYCDNCNSLYTFYHIGFDNLPKNTSDFLANNNSLKIA